MCSRSLPPGRSRSSTCSMRSGAQIEHSGQDFDAHKSGFSPKLLEQTLDEAGFAHVYVFTTPEIFEVRVFGFKAPPNDRQAELLRLPARP